MQQEVGLFEDPWVRLSQYSGGGFNLAPDRPGVTPSTGCIIRAVIRAVCPLSHIALQRAHIEVYGLRAATMMRITPATTPAPPTHGGIACSCETLASTSPILSKLFSLEYDGDLMSTNSPPKINRTPRICRTRMSRPRGI
jgi:hypothetical protein